MAALAETQIQARKPRRIARTPGAAVADFPWRPFDSAPQPHPPLTFTLSLASGASARQDPFPVSPGLAAVAAFLADAVHGVVDLATLARMIGCFGFARGALPGAQLALALGTSHGARAELHLTRPVFEVEATRFGAAHILHEDGVLGLYLLEIASGHSIPPHCHRLMREWELVLDAGLLQKGRPVPRGAAFAWPLGHVHSYRNPTARSLHVLCIDSPRFTPVDEVPLTPAPPLAPLAPFAAYRL